MLRYHYRLSASTSGRRTSRERFSPNAFSSAATHSSAASIRSRRRFRSRSDNGRSLGGRRGAAKAENSPPRCQLPDAGWTRPTRRTFDTSLSAARRDLTRGPRLSMAVNLRARFPHIFQQQWQLFATGLTASSTFWPELSWTWSALSPLWREVRNSAIEPTVELEPERDFLGDGRSRPLARRATPVKMRHPAIEDDRICGPRWVEGETVCRHHARRGLRCGFRLARCSVKTSCARRQSADPPTLFRRRQLADLRLVPRAVARLRLHPQGLPPRGPRECPPL
jgi:hypothetical protein